MESIFFDIGIMIIVATVFAFFIRLIKQPLIPAYVFAGILIGPVGLGMINDASTIRTLAEIGISFLLFIVGMELDFRKLKDIGHVASIGGAVQIAILFVIGSVIARFLGFAGKDIIYIGLIVAFSSTMIVVKLLSDKKELNTLHGRIIIGILLMQDLLAIIALSILSTLGSSVWIILFSLFKGILILILALFVSKYVFAPIFKVAARSHELLFLLAITISFFFSLMSNYFGFSIAIGAFVAGVALANLPYNIEIIGRVKPLRDFFSTLFFVSLGMELEFTNFSNMIGPLIILILFILLIKPLIMIFVTSKFRYTKRTSFLTGISLAQISEFSLIIVAQGMLLGHIGHNIFSLTVILAVVTIIATSYFIKYDKNLYHKLSDHLNIFEHKDASQKLEYDDEEKSYNAILIGYDRIGYSIYKTLHKLHTSVFVVDFNPDLVKKMIHSKVPCLYGDIGDIEILERLNLKDVEIVVSTVPDEQENELLIKKVKEVNDQATIFVTANKVDEALSLYDVGADYVILPHFLGGNHVSLLLEDVTNDIMKLVDNKVQHIEELKHRKHIGHEHPKLSHHHKER